MSKNEFGFYVTTLHPAQYYSYGPDGEELARREVSAHELRDGTIEFILRSGEEFDAGDGVGVSLIVTPEDLEELGYVQKEGEDFDFMDTPDLYPVDSFYDDDGFELFDPDVAESLPELEPLTPAQYFGTTEEIYDAVITEMYGHGSTHNLPNAVDEHFEPGNCVFEEDIRSKIEEFTNPDLHDTDTCKLCQVL